MRINEFSKEQITLVRTKIEQILWEIGMRVEMDARNETIGYKIREATMEKVPYQFVVGDKEVEDNTVSVSSRKEGKLGAIKSDEIIEKLVELDRSKKA